MPSELIAALDIPAALNAEGEHVPDLLPKQLVDVAVSDHQAQVAAFISELAQAGPRLQPASNVVALKWRHGRRTVATLALQDRVLYRAVVRCLEPDLVPRVRGKEAFDDFQSSPLEHENVGYVVMTDLSNFYSSIDLTRLSHELLRRTGRWEPVDWLRRFWESTSGGFGGIPQMNPASDVIGDTYADLVHRGLLRKGFAAWRYADDFRIACRSYGECVTVLEEMDEIARSLGLSLNERKTLTPSVEKYRDIVEGPERRLERINAEVTADLTGFDPYSWEEVSPEEAEVLQASAVRVMELWTGEHQDDAEPDPEAVDLTQVLPRSLLVLGVSNDVTGLPSVPLLLRYEPQLTPIVSRYLKLVAPDHAADVAASIADCLLKLTLTKWQRLWLLNVFEDLNVMWLPEEDQLLSWMHEEAGDTLDALRCQAAWSLARSYSLRLTEFEGLLASGSRYAEPFAAASVHGISSLTPEQRSDLVPSGVIERLVSAWSQSTPYALPF